MSRIHEFVKRHARVAISLPALLCCVQFFLGLYTAISKRDFDSETILQLLSYADGVETVVLFFILVALKNKKTVADSEKKPE